VAEHGAAGLDDALDWASLHAAVSGCQACALRIGCKAPVMAPEPQPRQADWLVVGDPPDEDEERAGTAFAGASGELLDNMLRAVQASRSGLAAEGARATNVVKCRSGVVRNPTPDELATCSVHLRREVALVQPRVILAMGRFAALSLLGDRYPDLPALPFGQWRGKVYSAWGVPVVVTYHPAKLLRAPQGKAHAWADLCLAQSLVRQPVALPDAQPGPRMDPPSP
jgi:uracil-DNA glycosylase family 4